MKQRGALGRDHLRMLPAPAPSSARLPRLEPLPPRTQQGLPEPPRCRGDARRRGDAGSWGDVLVKLRSPQQQGSPSLAISCLWAPPSV